MWLIFRIEVLYLSWGSVRISQKIKTDVPDPGEPSAGLPNEELTSTYLRVKMKTMLGFSAQNMGM